MGILGQCQLYQRIVFRFAQQDTDGGILETLLYITVEIVDIHLHLSQILVAQAVCFQVYQHVAPQQSVVKDQVYKEMFFVESKPFLACFKQEAAPHLQQKHLHLVDDGLFKAGFCINGLWLQP